MAYPTFDTEGGGNIFLQCVDAAGDSHALAAVEIATANSVQHGWIGVATHVEGDAVAAPGGFTTGAAPLVLVAADDGTNAVPLQADASAFLKVVLQAGTAAYGKLAANSGVDIGDVDVLTCGTITPGTGATSLGKAEDAGHSSGDVGVMALSVRQDTAAALGGTDADYQPLITDANGRLHVLDANSAAIKTAVELIDNAISGSEMQVDVVASLPAGTNAIGKLAANTGVDIGDVDVTSIVPGVGATNLGKAIDSAAGATDTGIAPLAIRDDALSALTPVEGDWAPLRVNSTGALHVTGAGGGTQYAVDVALGATPTGTVAIAIRDDALSALGPVEGDAIGLRVDANGALWTRDNVLGAALSGSELQVDVVAALPAGTNAIGKLAANTGVDIGDVDITSLIPGVAATSLGKAEDAAHSTGDTGVFVLAVRNDTLAALATADGDYAPLQVSAIGALFCVAEGVIAHDGVDVGHPIKIGGRAQVIIGAEPEEVADNDRVDALFDRNGRLGVTAGSDYKYADINDASSGDNEIIAAQAAGKRIAVWAILIVSDGTADVRWEDGAGGTAFTGQVPLQAREGYSISAGGLVPLFVGSAATALNLELSAAVNQHGFVSYTVLED